MTAGVIMSLVLIYLLAGAVDTGLDALFGNHDPLRLRTEGSLALLGSTSVIIGLLLLRTKSLKAARRG